MTIKDNLQLTLAILKPHVVKSPVALEKIRQLIIDNNLKVVRTKRKRISLEEAEFFYAEHKEKFFYHRLMTFMCSGPSDIHVLAGTNAIAKWRELMGPTKVYRAQISNPESIRGLFGLSDTRNATHGSDSPESAKREISIFFKDFDVKKWLESEGTFFSQGRLKFDSEAFLHTIDGDFTHQDKKDQSEL